MYPPAAAQQRIEGWVVLEFTVTYMGTIKDPKVVEFFPSDIFNQSALQAISKWKYKPRIIKGKKITSRGVQVKISFELDDI
jgi:protein TonB